MKRFLQTVCLIESVALCLMVGSYLRHRPQADRTPPVASPSVEAEEAAGEGPSLEPAPALDSAPAAVATPSYAMVVSGADTARRQPEVARPRTRDRKPAAVNPSATAAGRALAPGARPAGPGATPRPRLTTEPRPETTPETSAEDFKTGREEAAEISPERPADAPPAPPPPTSGAIPAEPMRQPARHRSKATKVLGALKKAGKFLIR